MSFPTIGIHSNPRHLGKMKKGEKVRLQEGGFEIALHPAHHKKVMKAFLKGKGVHHAMTPEEVKENHGRGFFDTIKSGASKAFDTGKSFVENKVIPKATDILNNQVIPTANQVGKTTLAGAKVAGRVLLPIGKELANKGVDMAVDYAPEALGGLAAAAITATGNPELAPLAYGAGHMLGKAGGKALGNAAHKSIDNFDPYHTQQVSPNGEVMSPSYNPNAPPSRQPQTNMLNAYTGENNGKLDRANMGAFQAGLSLSDLERLVAQSRQRAGISQFDYSGGSRTFSPYADAVPPSYGYSHAAPAAPMFAPSGSASVYMPETHSPAAAPSYGAGYGGHASHGFGLYGGAPSSRGRGLGGHLGYLRTPIPEGHGLYGGAIHPRHYRHRREVSSIGIQGNLIGHAEPPALKSQPLSANFQFGHTLPPAFQQYARSGR